MHVAKTVEKKTQATILQESKYYKKPVALFVLFVLKNKIIENASVTLLFCHTSDNTVYSLILNIAVGLTV